MVPEHHYSHMQARIPEIKQLFQSRRYVQCASICERYLIRNDEAMHPVHKAYLHFYFALVHDTMARETTHKLRTSSLDLAEQHYRAAIELLTPSEPYNLDELLSPFPGDSEGDRLSGYWRLSRQSFRHSYRQSYQSFASSTSSQSEDEHEAYEVIEPLRKRTDLLTVPSTFRPGKQRPVSIIAFDSSRVYHEEQFSADLFALLAMLHTHIQEVRQLRSAPPSSRLIFRPTSRSSSGSSGSDEEQLQWARKKVSFRPRFDPTSIRKLCNEALSEL